MDRRTYQELMNIYREMYNIDEKVGARGSVFKSGAGHADSETVKSRGNKAVGGGWTGSKQHGLGRDYKGNKDKVQKDFKKNLVKDKTADRGISPEARRERARKNKENKAKAGIDSLLKDIRGK